MRCSNAPVPTIINIAAITLATAFFLTAAAALIADLQDTNSEAKTLNTALQIAGMFCCMTALVAGIARLITVNKGAITSDGNKQLTFNIASTIFTLAGAATTISSFIADEKSPAASPLLRGNS